MSKISTMPRLGEPEYLKPFHFYFSASRGSVAKTVYLQPLYVPRGCTVNALHFRVLTGSAGQNMRAGIYADNGGTPVGGALLFDSGDVDVTAAAVYVCAIAPPRSLTRGNYWVCVATQDTVMRFDGASLTTYFTGGAHPNFDGCKYVLGAWGALTNPCPAVTVDSTARPSITLHVVSWDE